MGVDPRAIGIWRPFIVHWKPWYQAFRWSNRIFGDLTTGKNAAQDFVRISHLYVIKIVNFAQKLPQQIFLSLNLKTPFGSSEGQISRLQMHNKWSSNSHRPWVHTHFSKAWFFMKMASSEAALRLRSGFKVVSNSPWVGSLEGQVWLILVINWEKKTISLFHWAKNIVSICIWNIWNRFETVYVYYTVQI